MRRRSTSLLACDVLVDACWEPGLRWLKPELASLLQRVCDDCTPTASRCEWRLSFWPDCDSGEIAGRRYRPT
jgi:hypothetical protein